MAEVRQELGQNNPNIKQQQKRTRNCIFVCLFVCLFVCFLFLSQFCSLALFFYYFFFFFRSFHPSCFYACLLYLPHPLDYCHHSLISTHLSIIIIIYYSQSVRLLPFVWLYAWVVNGKKTEKKNWWKIVDRWIVS